MSTMLDDIGGEDGLHAITASVFSRAQGDEALRNNFAAADTPDRRKALEDGLRLFLDFETEQAMPHLKAAHEGLAGQGFDDEAFDALYGHYEDVLSAAGFPAGMMHSFLEIYEDLRAEVVA